MGLIYRPIPLDILLKMPPGVRARVVAQERARLVAMRDRQGVTLRYGALVPFIVLLIGVLFLIANH